MGYPHYRVSINAKSRLRYIDSWGSLLLGNTHLELVLFAQGRFSFSTIWKLLAGICTKKLFWMGVGRVWPPFCSSSDACKKNISCTFCLWNQVSSNSLKKKLKCIFIRLKVNDKTGLKPVSDWGYNEELNGTPQNNTEIWMLCLLGWQIRTLKGLGIPVQCMYV